jgi:uncharacterized repeat protein (TIGR03803 family)
MKRRINASLLLSMLLVAALGPMHTGRTLGQTFSTLHSFIGGSEGGAPSGLICSDTVLYGTTGFGGSGGYGTIFAVNTDGTGYTTLHSFSDGSPSRMVMVLSGTTLYGTTGGGTFTNGTVFKVNTDGTGFTSLHSFTALRTNSASAGSFTNSDGSNPQGGLVLDGGTLYGAADNGGNSGYGTIFRLNADGTGFTTLHNFSTLNSNSAVWTNSDGTIPQAILVTTGGTLYGAARGGGDYAYGTIFRLNADGTGFTTLHSFTGLIDGIAPSPSLLLSADTLYGVATYGGSSYHGTVFKLNTDGTGFTTLHSFDGTDGDYPFSMVLLGDTLFGITQDGGNSGNGTVFAVQTDGSGFTKLYDFTQTTADGNNGDGAFPSGLVLRGITLYGSASEGGVYSTVVSGPPPFGGAFGNGTVFSLSFAPPLTIIPSAPNFILSWPTNYAGFDYTAYRLQSTTSLRPSAIWTTNLPAPVVANGQNTVTNPISGTQQFFRLSQ